MSKVRIAIVGVGNCASSLVQGLEYYRDADPADRVPGLMHVELGGYHIRDVEVAAAFDVDAKKVGKDVAEAIFTEPNNTIRFADVPPLGVTVLRGRTLDSLGLYYRDTIVESDEPEADVVRVLRDANVDVLISYLPVGSEQADRFYAECATRGGRRVRERAARCSSRAIRSGRSGSPTPACRSWATTSRARSGRRSPTASWRSCSRTAASSSTGRTSSTSAATWTS